MTGATPTLAAAKAEAKRLRAERAAADQPISHGRALEIVARRHGFRDWNTCRAAIGDAPPAGFVAGGRVRGRYLSHPFHATVVSAQRVKAGWWRLSLRLDEPVDLVAFDGFSNLRRQIRGTVGPAGVSVERTSDGRPHLEIEM